MGIEIEKRVTSNPIIAKVMDAEDEESGVLNPSLYGAVNLVAKRVNAGFCYLPSEATDTSNISRFYSKAMDDEIKQNMYARVARKMRGILNFTSTTPATTTTNARNVNALWNYVVGVTAMYARYIHYMSILHMYDMETHELGELRNAVRSAAPWVDLSNSQYSNVREVLTEVATELSHLHFPVGLVDDMRWLFSVRRLTPRAQAPYAFYNPAHALWANQPGVSDPYQLLNMVQSWRRDNTVMELDRRLEEAQVSWSLPSEYFLPLDPSFDLEWFELWCNQGSLHASKFALQNVWMFPSAVMPTQGAARIPWYTVSGSITQRQLRYWAHRTGFSGKRLEYAYSDLVQLTSPNERTFYITGYHDALHAVNATENISGLLYIVAGAGATNITKRGWDESISSLRSWIYYDFLTKYLHDDWRNLDEQIPMSQISEPGAGEQYRFLALTGYGVSRSSQVPNTWEADVACQFMGNIYAQLYDDDATRHWWEQRESSSAANGFYGTNSQGALSAKAQSTPKASSHSSDGIKVKQLLNSLSAYVGSSPGDEPSWMDIQSRLEFPDIGDVTDLLGQFRGIQTGYSVRTIPVNEEDQQVTPVLPMDGDMMLVTQERIRQNVYDTLTYLSLIHISEPTRPY